MLPYSILMFVISGIFLIFSLLIYKGNTNLIHSYHQTKVKDKTAYGKAFGKALLVVAATPFISGVVGLLANTKTVAIIAVLLLILGIMAGFGCIFAVQKKYNQGSF